jgi:delta24-sterol reductase
MQSLYMQSSTPNAEPLAAGDAPSSDPMFADVQTGASVSVVDKLWKKFKTTRAYRPVMDFVTRHRGELIFALGVPTSFVFDKMMQARAWYFERFTSTPHLHDERVAQVQEQVRAWKASGSTELMCTARPGIATMGIRRATYKAECHRIAVNLRDILSVDEQNRTVRVEPLVNMGQLTRYLNPRGWALANMVEMDDLTVGGLVMGLGMSTSSHKWGLIQETVVAFEVVLADGRLVRASATENSDLFRALPWSHGTLGFLVAAELKIVPVKPYIRLDYIPCQTMEELRSKIDALASADDCPDVLEATIYDRNRSVIMSGRFADANTAEDKAQINPIGRWYKPWFYKYVATFLDRGGQELIPLREYYHRHTRSIFWELEDLIPFGNHPVYRYLLGWLGAPKISLIKMTLTPQIRKETITKHVVQDIIIPLDELPKAVGKFEQWFNVYPLLVYPIRVFDHGNEGFLRPPPKKAPGKPWQMYFDLGVYGVPKKVRDQQEWDAIGSVRAMEKYARDVDGYQCLYADTFMTPNEFEQMFDHGFYRQMRKKSGAEGAFPEVWQKVKRQR